MNILLDSPTSLERRDAVSKTRSRMSGQHPDLFDGIRSLRRFRQSVLGKLRATVVALSRIHTTAVFGVQENRVERFEHPILSQVILSQCDEFEASAAKSPLSEEQVFRLTANEAHSRGEALLNFIDIG